MSFDIDGLATFAHAAIASFAKRSYGETFYAFAIDASLLCLNSVEQFEMTLASYQAKFPGRYVSKDVIDYLRMSTGDWKYQGFADFYDEAGFDEAAYQEHYNLGLVVDDNAVLKETEYGKAMNAVLDRLNAMRSFDCLKRTPRFTVTRVEHDY
jgi:hypothetical protein